MKRKIIIGDVHCNYKGIQSILEKTKYSVDDVLVFVGDYIDGFSMNDFNANKTIELIINLKNKYDHVYTLLGNHDNWMNSWIDINTEIPYHGWYEQGGEQTLKSYGINKPMPFCEVKHLIPGAHIEFLNALNVCYFDDEIVVVHGGFQEKNDMIAAINNKITYGILWDREFFQTFDKKLLYYYKEIFGDRLYICGHTPNGPTINSNIVKRIMIDGGSNGGGKLYAVVFKNGKHEIVCE